MASRSISRYVVSNVMRVSCTQSAAIAFQNRTHAASKKKAAKEDELPAKRSRSKSAKAREAAELDLSSSEEPAPEAAEVSHVMRCDLIQSPHVKETDFFFPYLVFFCKAQARSFWIQEGFRKEEGH